MSFITTKDGTEIYYKDWGKGPVVTFSHGWPLSSDAWDGQMLFLAQNGFRVVAHDRRGHGRSSQASSGNDMNGYADDLAAVIEALDLTGATLVGHSTGGGEVARYIGRHGTKRVAKVVLISAAVSLVADRHQQRDCRRSLRRILAGLMADRPVLQRTWRSSSTVPTVRRERLQKCSMHSGREAYGQAEDPRQRDVAMDFTPTWRGSTPMTCMGRTTVVPVQSRR
jgi:pimeloyl-ACP methyl ester carboxylesterase